MRCHHLAGKTGGGGWLADLVHDGGDAGRVGRMDVSQIKGADKAVRQQHAFRNAAFRPGLFQRPQHRRRQRKIGGRRGGRHRQIKPGRLGGSRIIRCDKRQQMPQVQRAKGRHFVAGARCHRQKPANRLRGVVVKLCRRRAGIADTHQHRHAGGKGGIGSKGRVGTIKTKAFAGQFGIERNHHQSGAAGDVGIKGLCNHRQARNALLIVERPPDKRPCKGRWLAQMTGKGQFRGIGRGFRATPELRRLAMVDKTTIKGPPGRYKPCIGIQIAKADSRLDRAVRQRSQPINTNRRMRGIHQHDMKRLEKRWVDRPGIGVGQKLRHQRREHRIINAHGGQDISGELRPGNIAGSGAADDLGLVPERLEGTAHLIHHGAAGILVAPRHQLRLDKPLLPAKPWRVIGKLVDDILKRL